MDIRDLLVDGTKQMNDWLDDSLKDLSADQVNWLPPGKTVSIGFNAWHILRTQDNIVNFVLQDRKPPVWIASGFADRMGLPKVDQGTGMDLETARSLTFDGATLREYGAAVKDASLAYIKSAPLDSLDQVQAIRPLGEMPRWRVLRQIVMTHGFMHLGEINAYKGELGISFSI